MVHVFGIKSDLKSIVNRYQSIFTILFYALFTVASAEIMYLIETYFETQTNSPGCLGNFDYLTAIHYINTLHTTVGYGNVYPCTAAGKVFTVIYTLIAMPITLIVLGLLGKIFAKSINKVWNFVKKWKNKVGDRKIEIEENDEEVFPLSAAIILSLIFIHTCSLYFSRLEGWSYGDSVYYMWITLTTVGLGDFAPSQNDWVFLSYTLVYIGLVLVSVCINLLQMKIEKMIKDIQEKIRAKYRARRDELTAHGLSEEEIKKELAKTDDKKGSGGWNVSNSMEGKLLSVFVSDEKQEKIMNQVKETIQMVDKRDIGIQVCPELRNVRLQVEWEGKPKWKI